MQVLKNSYYFCYIMWTAYHLHFAVNCFCAVVFRCGVLSGFFSYIAFILRQYYVHLNNAELSPVVSIDSVQFSLIHLLYLFKIIF